MFAGQRKRGKQADVVLFDPCTIRRTITYRNRETRNRVNRETSERYFSQNSVPFLRCRSYGSYGVG